MTDEGGGVDSGIRNEEKAVAETETETETETDRCCERMGRRGSLLATRSASRQIAVCRKGRFSAGTGNSSGTRVSTVVKYMAPWSGE